MDWGPKFDIAAGLNSVVGQGSLLYPFCVAGPKIESAVFCRF
jgi:hypothetical protein